MKTRPTRDRLQCINIDQYCHQEVGGGGGGVWQGQESSFQNILFSNHSAVKREQIIFTLETMKLRQESGISISFIDS